MDRGSSKSKSLLTFRSSSGPRSSKEGREEVSSSNSTIKRSKSELAPASLSPSQRIGPAIKKIRRSSKSGPAIKKIRSSSKSGPAIKKIRRIPKSAPASYPPWRGPPQLPKEIQVEILNQLPSFLKFAVICNDFVKGFVPESLEGFNLVARFAISRTDYVIIRCEVSSPEFGISRCCIGKLQNQKEATVPDYISKVGSKNNYSLCHTDRILCSAEGLVCVGRKSHAAIFNPTNPDKIGTVSNPPKMKILGFGCAINEGLKLIAVDNFSKQRSFPYKVYSSKRSSWTKVLKGPGDYLYAIQPGKYLNGYIYFLAQKPEWKDKISSVLLVLLQFNFQSEKFDFHHLPKSVVQMKVGDVHIEPIYNGLAISCKNDASTNVWIANDKGRWSNTYKFPHFSIGISSLLFVLSYNQVLVKSYNSFYLVNPTTGAVQAVLPHLRAEDSTICFKSHVSPYEMIKKDKDTHNKITNPLGLKPTFLPKRANVGRKKATVQVDDDDCIPVIGDDDLSSSSNNEMALGCSTRSRREEFTSTVQHTGPSSSTHLSGDSLAQISTNVEAQLVGTLSTMDASTSRRAYGKMGELGVRGLVKKHGKHLSTMNANAYNLKKVDSGEKKQEKLRVQDEHCSTLEALPLTDHVKGLGTWPSSSFRTSASSADDMTTIESEIGLVNKIQRACIVLGDYGGGDNPFPSLWEALPTVAVISGQSSGKSSVLESIVGRDFLPRGSGIVMRRPLVLQLHKMDDGTQEYAEFLHIVGRKFSDFALVRKEIQDESDRITGKTKMISPVPIHLSIYSPNVVNLTLIDLPGLTKVVVEGQPESIVEDIENMVRTYVEKPNCIILAISPANQDIATSDAIKLAREVDPTGERTRGVLTKLDLMDKGTNALDVIEGRSYCLQHPWVGIVNCSQADINKNVDMIVASHKEWEYHATSPEHLAKRLSKHLKSVIMARIPSITSWINKSIKELESGMDPGRPIAVDAGAKQLAQLLDEELQKRLKLYESARDDIRSYIMARRG